MASRKDTTKEVTVYLAGTLNHPWREAVKQRFQNWNVRFIDPEEFNDQAMGVFVQEELMAAYNADAVLAYISPDDPSGKGTMAEVTVAFNAGKLVFYVDESLAPHPFMLFMSHVFRTDLESGIKSFESWLMGDDGYVYVK